MNRRLHRLAILVCLIHNSVTGSPRIYQIDPAESRIGFTVRHFFTAVDGSFESFEGTIHFDPSRPESSSVTARVDARSINTDNRERDQHLRNEDFFDTDRFPDLTFVSTEWIPDPDAGEGHYRVTGNLVMRGQEHPVVLLARYVGSHEAEPGVFHSRWVITASLNRSRWEIDYGKGVVGTTVEILIELLAVSASRIP